MEDRSAFASVSHTHAISDISSLQTTLDGKLSLGGGTLTSALTISNNNHNTHLKLTRSGVTNSWTVSGNDMQLVGGGLVPNSGGQTLGRSDKWWSDFYLDGILYAYKSDTEKILETYNTSATGNPAQFYIRHNYGNVDIANTRGNIYFETPAYFETTAVAQTTMYVGDSVQHWGDGGTGMYFGTDVVSFNTGSTLRLAINNAGVESSSNIIPITDRTLQLGRDDRRWQIVFCEILDSAGQHEKNLQNPEGEKSIADYETGTVLVWKGGKNVPCTTAADHMRMGIAVKGIDSPLIQGAEPVLVTGSVNEGDYLVTSTKEGHAEAISPEFMRQHNLFDCVLGKALESAEGESHLVKTWINI